MVVLVTFRGISIAPYEPVSAQYSWLEAGA